MASRLPSRDGEGDVLREAQQIFFFPSLTWAGMNSLLQP